MRFSLFRRQPDPDRIEVAYAGTLYPVTVRRRATARRLTLRVSQATGEITLTLPERVDFTTGRVFAEKHGGWIAARLAKRPQGVPFEPGAVVPLSMATSEAMSGTSTADAPTPTSSPIVKSQ